MALNRVILFGRIVRDPDYRQTQSGTSVCRFTVACDRQYVNKQTNERECDFIECQAWRGAADFVSRYFQKGSAITVEGSIQNNNYTDNNGVKHYTYVVVADNVGFGGDKRQDSQGGGQQAQTAQTAQNYAHASPQAAAPAQNASVIDVTEFETVLSGDEVPF